MPFRKEFVRGCAVVMAMVLGLSMQAEEGKGASRERDAEMAWGKPVDGLRVGIACATPSTTSDKQPLFTVKIENVSSRTITVPAPSSYVPKTHERVKGFFVRPLHPEIEKTDGSNATYSMTGGEDMKAISNELLTLKLGESLVLEDVPLNERSYCDGHDDYGGKTTLKRWVLLPNSDCQIRFSFENENPNLKNKKAWVGKATSGALPIHIKPPPLDGFDLVGKFTLPKTKYFVFEPIFVTFSVTNRGKKPAYFESGGDYRGTGRHERFSITATDEKGGKVEDPIPFSCFGGGLGGMASMEPGKTYTETLLVNAWCAFTNPGRYTITCKRSLNLRKDSDLSSFGMEAMLPVLPIETKLTITLHEDAKALEGYIRALVENKEENGHAPKEFSALARAKCQAAFPAIEKLARTKGSYQREAVEWLGYYGKERASASMLEVAKSPDAQIRTAALEILAEWKDPKGVALVRDALLSTNLEERQAAVLLCSRGGLEACFPALMQLEGDKDPLVRRYLSAALSACGDKRAIPVLLKLLQDPDSDPDIKIWAASGLSKLGRKDGIPVLISLLKLKETRGCRGNIIMILEEITGKKMREDYDEWHAWWEREGQREAKP